MNEIFEIYDEIYVNGSKLNLFKNFFITTLTSNALSNALNFFYFMR
jgi:hypothetical protein